MRLDDRSLRNQPGPGTGIATMTKIFIASLIAFASAPAVAQPPVAVATVETFDLDLSTAAGQRALDLRLTHAVRDVCGEASDADVAGKNAVRRCRAETMAGLAGARDERIAKASSRPIAVAAR